MVSCTRNGCFLQSSHLSFDSFLHVFSLVFATYISRLSQLACCRWFRAVDPDDGHATVLIAHLTERLRADADLDGVRRIVRGARRAIERQSTHTNSGGTANESAANAESNEELSAAISDRSAAWRAVLDRVEAEVQTWIGKHYGGARLEF